ncbi:MAG: hypothetical protein ACRDLT_13800 [Solirubrobacteraceae bacterium]
MIAALTVGASLAVASSASAIPVPIGSSADAPYGGTGAPASVYSLYNAASNVALVPAEDLIVLTNGILAGNSQAPVDASFTTAFTSASSLTSSNVAEIATDIAASANTANLEFGTCVSAYLTAHSEQPTTTNVQSGSAYCKSTSSALSAAATEFTGTIQPGVASAATSWPDLSQLVGFLGSASGTMQSADSATVSSSGTVTSITQPLAYNVALSAPSGGYIVPSAFGLTFPAGLSVNAALVADEVNASSNTTAVELNPNGTSIGTVTLTSPLADEFGGSNNQLVGKIYVVQTGQSSGQGSATQPYLELWFPGDGAHPIYDLGSFPSSLAFPLTLNFGEAFVSLLNAQEPLPLNSLEVSFPAATSPVKTSSCTTLGTAGGAITDSIGGLAYEFGDTGDGVSSATGTPAAVTLAATPTVVTNQCVAMVAKHPKKIKNTAGVTAAGLTSGHPIFRVKIKAKQAFKTITITLPRGLHFVKAKAKKLAKEITGAKIKSVRIIRGKLVIRLKKAVKSETIKTKRSLIGETKGLIKSIKKHKTKKLTLRVRAGRANIKSKFKA